MRNGFTGKRLPLIDVPLQSILAPMHEGLSSDFVADSGVNAASPDRRKSLTVRYDARAAVPDPKLTVREDAPFVAHVAKNEVFDEVQDWRRGVPS